jgi:uncharacterized membrane protein
VYFALYRSAPALEFIISTLYSLLPALPLLNWAGLHQRGPDLTVTEVHRNVREVLQGKPHLSEFCCSYQSIDE